MKHLARFLNGARRALRRPEVIAGGSTCIAGIAVAAVGLSDLPAPLILAATGLLTAAAALAAHAVAGTADFRERYRALAWAFAALSIYVIGSVAILLIRDDPESPILTYALNGASETECLRLSGEPGGPGLYLGKMNTELQPLCGGQSYHFECSSKSSDGAEWLRLTGTTYWVPAAAMHRVPEDDGRPLPPCAEI